MKKPVTDDGLLLVFLAGAIARTVYFIGTYPPELRSHDYAEHAKYILYVATRWTLPLSSGWETHQPPLYYYLSAAVYRLATAAGAPQPFRILQLFALMLGITTIGIGVTMAIRLFPRNRERMLYAALLCTAPVLAFPSAFVSNDALIQLMSFAFFALLLRWWQTGRAADWYLVCFSIALGCLTKGNAYLFFPCAFIPLLFRRKAPRRARIRLAACGMAIIVLLAGWFPAYRYLTEDNPTVFPFSFGTFEGHPWALENTPRNYLTFNPVQVLRLPYNDSVERGSRREFFWEYMYKSLFYSQFRFSGRLTLLVRTILLLGFAFIPVGLYGFWLDVRYRTYATLPLWLSAMTVFSGSLALRAYNLCGCSQDIRLALPLVLFFAYYAARGTSALQNPLRQVMECWGYMLSLLCGLFLCAVVFFR